LLKAGRELAAAPALFPRLEDKAAAEAKREKGAKEPPPSLQPAGVGAGLVDVADFKKVELRVAEIVAVEPVKNSHKLLKITLVAPEPRVIVAGIAEAYRAEELLGRQVLIVANLKPAKLMGITSQGMILVAKTTIEGREKMVLVTAAGKVAPGSVVA
jgi:methionyl-tRNA synthetase